MQVNANVTFQFYDVNVQNSNANRPSVSLGIKLFDDFVGADNPVSLSAPMADRISAFTLRIALNERSGVSKSTPVVPSSLLNLVPGFLSKPSLCRDG